ncbi:unnamed protein product [Clonostachys byssicola]|uniref:CENP-V/GFA domain-containing protein n=1 Tax=Clonostachys byssicola TaxID=160290 RepID=A0A9N9U7X3_9HYPO|nr:unnamed protein product [Clonostachys byssicola]
MADADNRTASCLCRSISLTLAGEPSLKVLCHCDSCKKASGVVFQANTFWPKENITVSDPEGMLQEYRDTSPDSGRYVLRSFCRNCGSFIMTTNPTHPDISNMVIVPIGIINGEKESMIPSHEFFVKQKLGWLESRKGVHEYQGME